MMMDVDAAGRLRLGGARPEGRCAGGRRDGLADERPPAEAAGRPQWRAAAAAWKKSTLRLDHGCIPGLRLDVLP
jgi:hypothetical protein